MRTRQLTDPTVEVPLLLKLTGMGFITMWTNGARRCVLVIGGTPPILRLVDATSVIRDEGVCSDAAASLAALWKRQEDHALSSALTS